MKIVQADDVRAFFERAKTFDQITSSIGRKRPDADYLERTLGLPAHFTFLVERIGEDLEGPVPADVLDSIPFYSLCKGLFLPLSAMAPEKAAQLFGLKIDPPPDQAGREKLVLELMQKDIGLDPEEKLGCVLGDAFLGQPSTFRRDSLMRLLMTIQMVRYTDLLVRLASVGDVAVLFAQARKPLRVEPALTAKEVLYTLYYLPKERRNKKFDLLRSLYERCGSLEAYFLTKLLLRRAGFGFDYEGPILARVLAAHYGVNAEHVAHAMALTDVFHVARVLAKEGAAGLRKIQLRPLVAVRPALASGSATEVARYPVWVERKYDGIRLMLHKAVDEKGNLLCGAYTRTRNDWLELVPGLDLSIKALPARDAIVDGELYGTVFDLEGVRPASVYEVYAFMQGEKGSPVNLKYAAFDVVYMNGQELTQLPLSERRKHLAMLLGPLAGYPLPVPLTMSEGQLASNKDDVNKLYHHFRSQGYEGIIAKDLEGTYRFADRDPHWLKRKPEITLDLVLLAGVLAVTEKVNVGAFGSYAIGARLPDGSFQDVGDVAGVDLERDRQIQQEIFRNGLLTGRRVERQSASGTRPGMELVPSIVVTVRFEGIARELNTGKLSLRGPKLALIRSDKSASEADTVQAIEEIYLRQRVG